jgi:hypothetical protein
VIAEELTVKVVLAGVILLNVVAPNIDDLKLITMTLSRMTFSNIKRLVYYDSTNVHTFPLHVIVVNVVPFCAIMPNVTAVSVPIFIQISVTQFMLCYIKLACFTPTKPFLLGTSLNH